MTYFQEYWLIREEHMSSLSWLQVRTYWFLGEDENEPPRDKTNKVSVRPAKTQISLGIRPVWSVFAVCMKKTWVLSYPLSAQRRLLIRLGGCLGWSESSLDAQPHCWFCHEAAQIWFCSYNVWLLAMHTCQKLVTEICELAKCLKEMW